MSAGVEAKEFGASGNRARRITEVTTRAVHGRAPIASGDPELKLTAEQRQAVADHVRCANESAVEAARRSALSKHASPASSVGGSGVDEIERKKSLDLELRRALADLAAVSRAELAAGRAQIQRDVAALEQRSLPIEEVIAELRRLALQVPRQ